MHAVEQSLFGFGELEVKWRVSRDTLVRAADSGELRTVYLGGRRLVPLDEVKRVESSGFGRNRKQRRAAKAK